MATMKAALYDGKSRMNVVEMERPVAGPGHAIVRVRSTGICGSDLLMNAAKTERDAVPYGHEVAGEVVEVGDGVDASLIGLRVAVDTIGAGRACQKCWYCRMGQFQVCVDPWSSEGGGFAQYIAIPDRNAFRLPDSIPMDQGAIVGCAVSTAYHALQLGGLKSGETVVVFGLGGVGLHAVSWAKAMGAGAVVGVDNVEAKLESGKAYGADLVLHAERDDAVEAVRSLTDGYGAELALECSGHQACVQAAIGCLHGKSGYESGRLVGVAILMQPVHMPDPGSFREGAYMRAGDHTRDQLREVIRLIDAGRVDLSGSVTHRFRFDELEKAMELVESRRENVIRAVLTMDE